MHASLDSSTSFHVPVDHGSVAGRASLDQAVCTPAVSADVVVLYDTRLCAAVELTT